MNEVLRLENICLGSPGDRAAIQNLSISLCCGDYKVVSVERGPEESHLLKMIVGELKPQAGSGLLLGYPILNMSSRRRRQLLQQIGIITGVDRAPHESLSQFVALPLRIAGARFSQIERRVRTVLRDLDLTLAAGSPVRSLTGRQRRLAAVAQALIKSPKLILMESRSDEIDRQVIEPLLRKYSLHGGAVLELVEERNSADVTETMVTSHEEAYVPA